MSQIADSKQPPSEPSSIGESLLQQQLELQGLKLTPDGFVHWKPGNKRHPRNWSKLRKGHDVSIILLLEMFTTLISAAGSAVANASHEEFNISKTLAIFLFVPMYLIGQGIGSIIFPPYSEVFGRKKLYIVSTLMYSASCILIAVVPNYTGVVVGRLLSGFLSAIPTNVVAGSIEDMFNARDRIWFLSLWMMLAPWGLALGPIYSTYIIYALNWRWVFYVAAIVTGLIACLLLGIRESRPPLLLDQEVRHLCHALGDKQMVLQSLNPDRMPDLHTFVTVALFRPIYLFFTEPIIFLVSVISAIPFTLIYMFTEALPPIYRSFGFSPTHACLPFLALGLGCMLGMLTRIYDYHLIMTHHAQRRPLRPEDKLIGFAIGAPVFAAGLWLFAWTIPPAVTTVHWMGSAVALVMVGYAANEFGSVLTGYLADSYLSYAASGFAAQTILRTCLSAGFPLFAPAMFGSLGANVAGSVLAGVATAFCLVPPLFWRYGERIRAQSRFARYSLDVYNRTTVDEEGF
ncbi:putative MFS multidrug transporter [Aspergillus clavatus NRRL 1]|uniref:MFS multidrug transporter, putative n=1 Tax=Aspergillus clavatus (strain ATCC 1007 / CBS 513.65 / DSM 816 / NCTC 3887 / NRRL 1 / QM 1276 / 107) TaxID=344612 RepID=A1CLW8_ASPCL|nr:MFS multidrug transporter, putative [Aspergillus clavatus NRRL 1]EAW09097.1 MFS multidrug transporter, putative [Aspergillus clavatus NRRL 1]